MIIRQLSSLSFVFAAVAAPAAADPASSAQPANPPAAEEKICEKITVTGSRLATRKICATRAEWEERRRADRDAVEQIQSLRLQPCSSVNQPGKGGVNC